MISITRANEAINSQISALQKNSEKYGRLALAESGRKLKVEKDMKGKDVLNFSYYSNESWLGAAAQAMERTSDWYFETAKANRYSVANYITTMNKTTQEALRVIDTAELNIEQLNKARFALSQIVEILPKAKKGLLTQKDTYTDLTTKLQIQDMAMNIQILAVRATALKKRLDGRTAAVESTVTGAVEGAENLMNSVYGWFKKKGK